MIVNIYLNINLHSLIPPFTESATKSVEKRVYLYVGILDTFFVGKLFGSWIKLFKTFLVS